MFNQFKPFSPLILARDAARKEVELSIAVERFERLKRFERAPRLSPASPVIL